MAKQILTGQISPGKSSNSAVKSVNGQVGDVVLTNEDLGAQAKLTAGENISISEDNIISAIDTTYDIATTDKSGLLSASDKSKLNGIEDGAQANVQPDWLVDSDISDDYIKNKPTKLSDFENDKGYIVEETDPTVPEWAKAENKPEYNYSEITNAPNKLSDFTNDSGFITEEVDPTVPEWAKAESKPSYSYSEISDVPTKLSDFNNDTGFITEETDPTVPEWAKAETKPSYDYSEIENTPGVATQETAGLMSAEDKIKLDNSSGGGAQSDWNETDDTKESYIKNKPTIPTTLTELKGTLPLANGGTGGTTLSEGLAGLHRYYSLQQLNISKTPTTTYNVVNKLPPYSTFSFYCNTNYVSDAPCSGTGHFLIFKSGNEASRLVLYAASNTSGTIGNNFYIADASSSSTVWHKIYTSHPSNIIPIANGGTGKSTAEESLAALGGAKSSDLGDVSTLTTESKTAVGAINELNTAIGDIETALTAIIREVTE